MFRTVLPLGLSLGLAFPVGAQVGIVVRPADCTLQAVIQFAECWFQRSYTCGSENGTIFRAELVAWDGAVSVEHRNSDLMPAGFAIENGPIQSYLDGDMGANGGSGAVLAPKAGHSEYQLSYSIFGVRNLMTLLVDQEAPSLGGQIDGIEFRKIVQDVEMRFPPPMPPVTGQTVLNYVAEGTFYFVEGGTTSYPEGGVMGPHKPMKIVLPAEGAADVAAPEFGCDHVSSLTEEIGARFA